MSLHPISVGARDGTTYIYDYDYELGVVTAARRSPKFRSKMVHAYAGNYTFITFKMVVTNEIFHVVIIVSTKLSVLSKIKVVSIMF
jgi:hypothetical protein